MRNDLIELLALLENLKLIGYNINENLKILDFQTF